VHLSIGRLNVAIFEQEAWSNPFGIGDSALQTRQGSRLTGLNASTEMEASVHHEPGAPQTVSNINVRQ